MEKETWQEHLEALLAETKARYVNSIVRNAYTDSETILYFQEKIKSNLEILEGYLTEEIYEGTKLIDLLIGTGREYEIMNAELKLAESEVQLIKAELKLYDKMIDIDWALNRQDQLISRFLAEDALRLSEAEVRFTEAEVRLAENYVANIELDMFYDPYNEAAKYIADHDRWLDSLEMYELEAVVIPEKYDEMVELSDYYYMKGCADLEFERASTEVRIAKLKMRLAKEELCVAKSKLILAELEKRNAELEKRKIESKKPDQLIR
ncbi:MAG: hypothetical protein OXI43_23240 [Candidatus Poribacteria bacterium]|nr:hypothetical protein [Candidatus Poribacteria bacterium]